MNNDQCVAYAVLALREILRERGYFRDWGMFCDELRVELENNFDLLTPGEAEEKVREVLK